MDKKLGGVLLLLVIVFVTVLPRLTNFYNDNKTERDIGTFDRIASFQSQYVQSRNVDVWLPPGYNSNSDISYAVLYMHDGQNLFFPEDSFLGITWNIDGVMLELIEQGIVEPAIVVGIWNSPLRFEEYMPAEPVHEAGLRDEFDSNRGTKPKADDYLKFIVEELKPFIDSTYNTRSEKEFTHIMGSSMGGLISLYAAAKYPNIFNGIGAVSTHWSAMDGLTVNWLSDHLPPAGTNRLYFDFGTTQLDESYESFQLIINQTLIDRGFIQSEHFVSLKFEGAGHNEQYWQDRVHISLQYLLRGEIIKK